MSSNTSTPSVLKTSLLALCIGIFALATHSEARKNAFVYDDTRIIRDNPLVQGPLDAAAIFSSNYWFQASERDPLYRPLTIVSFALQGGHGSPSPAAVMSLNVLIHALTTILLLYLLLQLGLSLRLSALAASVFAVMPIHVEAIANGVGRAELLAAFFSLLTAYTYFALVSGQSTLKKILPAPELLGILLSCLFAFCAMISKESAIMCLPLIVLLDQLCIRNGSFYERLRSLCSPAILPYLALTVPALAYLGLRDAIVGLAPPSPHELLGGLTTSERVAVALKVLVEYVQQSIVPLGISADYHDYRIMNRPQLFSEQTLAPLSAFLLLWGASFIAWRSGQPLPLMALLWFFLCILPTSNLIVAIGVIRADRLMYFPSIGCAIALAWILHSVMHYQRVLGSVLFAGCILSYALYSMNLVTSWQSKESLWTRVAQINPGSADAWRNIGDVHLERQEYQAALDAYTRSRDLRQTHDIFDRSATLLLAKTQQKLGNRENAIEHYKEVLRRDPNHLVSAISLGQLYLEQEHTLEDALRVFRFASDRHAQNPHPIAHEAEALKRLGRLDEALERVDQAINLGGGLQYIYLIKAAILEQLGQLEAAEEVRAIVRSKKS